jgi:hypothetical protein
VPGRVGRLPGRGRKDDNRGDANGIRCRQRQPVHLYIAADTHVYVEQGQHAHPSVIYKMRCLPKWLVFARVGCEPE